MTREEARALREAIEVAIIRANLDGVVLSDSRATYGDMGEFTVKLTFKEVSKDGVENHDKEEAELHRIFAMCPIDRPIPKKLYGARVTVFGKEYTISGARPRAKSSVILENAKQTKYVATPEMVKFIY